MTGILGISAFYHDAAAALVVDGRIVAAAQEERFTRKKHDPAFPRNAVEYCLRAGGLTPDRLDLVGFYDKPLLKLDRILETHLAYAPRGLRAFATAMPPWLRQKLWIPRVVRQGLGGGYRRRIVFAEHHESHAASAFFPSPFERAAILTLDGVGEWATASLAMGEGNRIRLTHELRFPHSLGLLYSAFTYFCGFKVNSGEYKLMGLAPYGRPRYVDRIRRHLLDLRPDGSFRLNLAYFDYGHGLRMTGRRFARLFDGPPRSPEAPLTEREMDLAGGVALNCVGNGRILREGPFERVWIQPAAGDAGGALGVALLIWHQLLGNPRTPEAADSQHGSLLGPSYEAAEIRAFLDATGAVYRRYEDEGELVSDVADLLANERVVGFVNDRMEFGPRALGSRSILGDPRSARMQSQMNRKIKFRESFRPFAPAVLRERAHEFFDTREGDESPYMLLVAPVREGLRTPASMDGLDGIEKLRVVRSTLPVVTHVDYSARIQTVDAERHGRFHRLLEAFARKTGCPVLVNTSFNVRGEPIVCTPEDAYRCFLATDMDALVLGDFVLEKTAQPARATERSRAEHLAAFERD